MTTPFAVHQVQRPGRSVARIIRPTSVRAALEALAHEVGSRPVAGGTDLLVDLQRGGPGDPTVLVDLTSIDGFRTIEDSTDVWVLGGGVTHNQVVMHDGLVQSVLPLAQACLEVGSPQLRNRATIAGNLVTASPANDTISALMALDASLELMRLDGDSVAVRQLPVREFFTGFRSTALEPHELVTTLHVPKLQGDERGMWVKLGLRRAQAISVVHAGIVLGFDGDIVRSARLAMGSVAPTVVRVAAFEEALVGSRLEPGVIEAAARAATSSVAPISDGRATAEYRSEAIVVLLRRTLAALAAGEQSSMWPTNPPTLSTDEQISTVSSEPHDIAGGSPITVVVNDSEVTGSRATVTLLDWIRDVAGFTGMKEGCAEGECGACTMLLDGAAVMSCLVPAAQADARRVTTVEGLDHPIQQAFVDDFAVQCGFCIPGFLVSSARLLEESDDPDDEEIRLALSGNLCRCTGYYPIIDAVRDAAVVIRGGGA